MRGYTLKRQFNLGIVVAALVALCGTAWAGTDTEQFARFKDPNQWGAPAGDLNLNRYSALKQIDASSVKNLQYI